MRDDDLGLMQRAVLKPDGTARLLRWLGQRLNGPVVLLDSAGKPAQSFGDCPADVLRDAADDIKRVTAGEIAAASISGPDWWARVASAAKGRGGPALLVTSRAPLSPDDGALVAPAAALLELRWSADRRDKAIMQIREAVLHLLMAGEDGSARRVASAMKPDLAAMVRVYLVEGPAAARNAIADKCETACDGRAWIIRCPVYRHHVIILSSVDDARQPDRTILSALRAAADSATAITAIGAGGTVPLRDTAASYEQAYHALAVARHRPERFARYASADDLSAVLGAGARQWAQRTLAPLLDYEPSRPQDPDAAELRATLRSWLDFRGAAWRQLKLHRNTLADRLRHIAAILSRDLSQLSVQAELHLALQLLHRPDTDAADGPPDLDDLLTDQDVREWAGMMLAPLEEDQALLGTVRAWLAADTHPEATSRALGISDRGVRRRLERAEERLGRSLTGGPSARYDVQLALRIRARST